MSKKLHQQVSRVPGLSTGMLTEMRGFRNKIWKGKRTSERRARNFMAGQKGSNVPGLSTGILTEIRGLRNGKSHGERTSGRQAKTFPADQRESRSINRPRDTHSNRKTRRRYIGVQKKRLATNERLPRKSACLKQDWHEHAQLTEHSATTAPT
jgi:hypothetical protein